MKIHNLLKKKNNNFIMAAFKLPSSEDTFERAVKKLSLNNIVNQVESCANLNKNNDDVSSSIKIVKMFNEVNCRQELDANIIIKKGSKKAMQVDFETFDPDVSQLTYSEFVKGIAYRSSPIDQSCKHIYRQGQYEINKDNVSSVMLYEGCHDSLRKNESNSLYVNCNIVEGSHLLSPCIHRVNNCIKNSNNVLPIVDGKNCVHSVRKRVKKILSDRIKLGVDVDSLNRIETDRAVSQKKTVKLNYDRRNKFFQKKTVKLNHNKKNRFSKNSDLNINKVNNKAILLNYKNKQNFKLHHDQFSKVKYYLPSENQFVTKEIRSSESYHNVKEVGILENNWKNEKKREHFDALLLTKSSKKQCRKDCKELGDHLYLRNDKIMIEDKKKAEPHKSYHIEIKTEKCHRHDNLSLNRGNSLLNCGCECSVKQLCLEEKSKPVKNYKNVAFQYSEKNDDCVNNILDISCVKDCFVTPDNSISVQKTLIKGSEPVSGRRQLINDVIKNYGSCVSNKGCDSSLIARIPNNELIKSANNVADQGSGEIQTLNKSETTDTFTINQLYTAMQIGYVRSCGFLKDIIPCLKNGVKEEAVQFSCKTCMNTFSFFDVKSSFDEEDLCCLCPNNCRFGLHQKIRAEFSFKFVVKDLNDRMCTYFLIGKEAESVFGCTLSNFWHCSNTRHLVRRAVRNLLRSYDRKILSEFCISTKNLFGVGPKYLVNVGKKVCTAPVERNKS